MRSKTIITIFLTAIISVPAVASSQLRSLPSVLAGLISNGQERLINFQTVFDRTERLKVLVYASETTGAKALADFYSDFNHATRISRLNHSNQTENFEHVVIVPMLTPELREFMSNNKPEQGFSIVVDHNHIAPLLPIPNKGSILKYKSGILVDGEFD